MEEWKNSTRNMKDDYEKMKKEAQVEEYKFMEKIMIEFNNNNIENELKRKLNEIKDNLYNRKTREGETLN
jgi:hypothetical protein